MSDKPNLVVLTGAGISAESGLSTFRDNNGLWNEYSVYEVATPEAWQQNPELVLEFYNQRRREVRQAQPNAAHQAISDAEADFEVTVVTQNVDNLHERAGSSQVLHVHGLITLARSSINEQVFELHDKDIQLGDHCPAGSQLRPHVVWFGEMVYHMDAAAQAISKADYLLVIGTSLSVFPAAGLVDEAPVEAHKALINKEADNVPPGFEVFQGSAAQLTPQILQAYPKQT
ncbi:NAD-dependent protein deacylase [Aliidiomarina minuta]|uniref:protein acetyllysine N-acetyltransferase n=1 Tax=Aliidiomarina minuta TaxID=880057 RepID=A0A432W3K9_9GAMM|nr:NAD-dependent deacylase [Aliidiomarina minuta]RUO23943.1 NAD-dependent protein deacylase [Aliidiomarina minuta]